MKSVCGKMGKSAVLSAMVALLAVLVALLPVTPALAAGTWTSQRTLLKESHFNDVYFLSGGTTGWAVGTPYYDNDPTPVLHHCWYTNNGGTTWTGQTVGTETDLMFASMEGVYFLDVNNGYAVGERGFICKCANAAAGTWSVVRKGTNTEFLQDVIIFDASSAMVVGVDKPDQGDQSTWSPIVLQTSDGGTNWRSVDLYDTCFADALNGWAVGDGGVIIHTTDGGSTWAAQTSTTTNGLNGISAASTTVAWAVGAGGTIISTTDGGSTWAAQTSTTTNGLNGISAASTTVAWAVGAGGTIVKTINGGTNWVAQISGVTGNLHSVSAIDANNAWGVGHDTTSSSPVVLKTDDAGAHWRNVQLNDTFFFNASNGWAVGDGGTIISTTDGGSTWAAQTSTTTENLSGVSATSATVAWAVGAGGTIVNTTDGGTTWVAQTSTTTNGLSGISAASTTVAWAVGAGGTIVKTTDGGTTWAAQTSTTTNGLNGISAASTTVAWAVGAGGTIVKTANGTTWAAQTSTTTNGLRGVSSVSTNDVWAVGELRAIIGTTNGGTNWNVRSTIPHSCALYGVDFPAASDGFAVGSGGTIVKTSNSGVTWAAQTSTTTNDLNGISAASTTVAWAVGAGGTIVNTINGGTTWAAQTSTTTNDLNGVSSASTTVTWAVGELRAIIKTINGGTNWTHLLGISGPGGLYGVDVTPGGTVYASGFKDGTPDDGIVVNTADSGATFNVESPGTALHLYAIDCRDNNNMWAVGGGSGAGVVFHGDPAVPGAWTNQYPAVPNELHGVYADINGASYEIIAVGDNGYITYSTNSGGAWSPPPSITDEFNRNDLSGVWYENTGAVTGTGFAVGDDGTIMTTADRGATWAFQLGPANRLNDTSFQNTTDGWCVGTRGTIINTINGGTNWNVQDSAVTDDLNGVNFINAVYGWAVGENNVSLYTTSGGATWIPGPALTADLNDVFVYDDSGVSGNYLIWACGDGGVLRYTTNLAPGGAPAAWITPATAPPVEDLHGVYALNATDVWAVGANGTIANSIDGGANWGTQTSGVGVTLYGVCIADALNAWAVGDSGTIVNTTDGGANWGTQTSGTNACLYDVQFGDRSRTDIRNGWVVGAFAPPSQEGTVLATTDGGSSWNPETSNTGVGKGLYGLDLAWDGSNWAGYAAGDWGRVQKHTNATSQPEITLPLTPNQGPVTPPTAVTITGANFGADQATVNGHVYFYGGVDAGTASTWNNTTIIINVPSGAYSGLVHVVHEGGSSNGENFTVLPSITNVIPDPMSGGDTVTVTGEGFGDDPGAGSRSTAQENVKVGTYQMPDPNVTFWSNTQIEFTLPDDVDPGTAVGVTVTAGGNTSVGHNVVVKPEITSLTPSQGRTGDTITVSGANFGADPGPGFRATATHNVFINTSTVPQMVPDADVTSWAYNSIEFTIPYDFGTVRPRTGDVTVMSNSSTSAAGTTLTILPKIDPGGVTPDSGYVGDMIHVDGTCFGDTQGELNGKVYFNGVDAGAAVIWDDRDIDVHVPADATTGDVKVTTDGGDSNVLPFTVKPFLSSLSKNSGRVGDTVEITGTGFGPTKGAGTVKFNGVNATVTAWGSASITVTVPNDATSGEVVVTTTGGSTTGTNFWVMPTITSVDPTTGVPGDTVVTIKGYTYGATQGNSEVQFAGVSAGKAQSWSRTEIKVKVPGNAASGEVVVSTEGGISNGVFFSVGPKITSIEPGNGPPGIEVTIKGDNLKAIQGAGKVEFNGLDAGTANSWSETEIKIKVPTGATTGDVVVTTTDGPSNGVPFTVGPANIMYFAEGTTRPGFDQWICIMNPNDEVANVDITYMMSDGSTMPQLVVVEPTSRSTIKVIDAIGPDKDVSTKIASDKPVIAERPIYFSYHGLWTGGHDVVGAIAPATEWYFAEGTTRDGFDEWLCLQNPNATTVDVEITYMLQGGEVRTQTVEILPTSRETIDVKGFLGPNIDCSAKVTADAGIIAERPMYFNYQGYTALNWTGGHDVMGATSPATEWYFAEGTTRDGFDEWLCVQNPGLAPALVYISYMLGTGENLVQVEEVGAQSRKTISVAEFLGRGHDVSMTLTSNQPIVAERSMYFNYVGLPGGHDVVGATAPAAEWYFAEGATQNGFQEWLCIQNPNNEEAEVTITYMLGTGETQDQVITVKPRSRETVDVNSAVGWGKDVSARVTSSKPIIVERPMYFNYMSKWPGGHDVIGFSW